MKMTDLQAYEQLAKLSLELIDLQENAGDTRYKEINSHLVAISRARKIMALKLLDEGVISADINPEVCSKTELEKIAAIKEVDISPYYNPEIDHYSDEAVKVLKRVL